MAIQHSTNDIGINGGLNLKTNPHKLQPPQVTTANNVVYTTDGALRKRYGYSPLVPTVLGGGNISTGLAIQNVNGELCMVDGNTFWTYSQTANAWQAKGTDSPSSALLQEAITLPGAATYQGTLPGNIVYADIGNLRLVAVDSCNTGYGAGASSTGVYLGLWDKQKNTWLVAPNQSVFSTAVGVTTASVNPAISTLGTYFYVFYDIVGSGCNYVLINSTPILGGALPTVLGPYSLTNTSVFTTISIPDVSLIGTTTLAVVVGAPNYSYGLLFTNNQVGSTGFSQVATTPVQGIQTIGSNSKYLMCVSRNTYSGLSYNGLAEAAVCDTSSFTFNTPTYVPCFGQNNRANWIAFGPSSSGSAYVNGVICGDSNPAYGTQSPGYCVFTVTGTRSLTLPQIDTTYTGYVYAPNALQTQSYYPWQNGGSFIYPVSKPVYDTTVNDYVIWTLSTGQVTGSLQPTLSLQSLKNQNVLARVGYDNSNTVNTSYPITNLTVPDTANYTAIVTNSETISFVSIPTTSTAKQIIPLAQGAFVTGAQPSYYDGVVSQTLGFNGYPEMTPVLSPTTTGSLTPATTYNYTMIYREFDNTGRLVYSACDPNFYSIALDSTHRGVSIIPGTVVAPWPQYKRTYSAVLYRTTAADALNYRELTTVPAPGKVFVNLSIPQFTNTYTTLFDGVSDASLTANGLPFLYCQPVGGELPNDPPPACYLAVATPQRLFVASSEKPTLLYFSKPFNPNRAPEFNAESYLVIDPLTGPITGLAVMDGNLIIFKAGAIYQISGTGPDATGNGQFNPIYRIASDDGCINSNSVLATAQGTWFQGARGLQLLDRSLTVQYLGEPIESLIQANTITAGLVLPEYSQVRFWLSNGTVAVYDYLFQKWSTFSSASGNGYYASSACIWNGNQISLDNSNIQINQEIPNQFFDASFTGTSAITMTIETPWLVYSQPQSWNRLRRVAILGDYKSSNTAILNFAYDWQSSYIDTVAFTTSTGLINGDTVYQWIARAPRQVMQAVRLKLVDSNITGESYDITNFALEYAVKGSIAKLPSQKLV